jgi:probable addiction module antidote protein
MKKEEFKDGLEKLEVQMYRKDPELANLRLESEMKEYLETGDMTYVKRQLLVMAKAFGCARLEKATGLNRTTIYNVLGCREEPKLNNFIKIVRALGYNLAFAKTTARL